MLKNTTIGITQHFDAAHRLPEHKGKCKNLHGHTWKVTVEVKNIEQMDYDYNKDMIVDFHDLKLWLNLVIGRLDHHNLNLILETTSTCENLVEYFYEKLEEEIPSNIKITKILIQEGLGGHAKWER